MVSAFFVIKYVLFIAGVILLLSCKGIHSWSTTNHWSTRSTVVITHTANHHNHWWRYQNQIHNHRHIATKLHMTSSKGNHIIEVLHQPDSSFLASKGVLDWPTWGCPVSQFPWSYSETEICYLIRGKVMITPIINNNNDDDGSPPPTPVTIAAGDYVTLPAGLSCTWDVLEAVEKHYMFN